MQVLEKVEDVLRISCCNSSAVLARNLKGENTAEEQSSTRVEIAEFLVRLVCTWKMEEELVD